MSTALGFDVSTSAIRAEGLDLEVVVMSWALSSAEAADLLVMRVSPSGVAERESFRELFFLDVTRSSG